MHNKKYMSTGKVETSLGRFWTKKTLVWIGESLLAFSPPHLPLQVSDQPATCDGPPAQLEYTNLVRHSR